MAMIEVQGKSAEYAEMESYDFQDLQKDLWEQNRWGFNSKAGFDSYWVWMQLSMIVNT